jgi:hypothetical protein
LSDAKKANTYSFATVVAPLVETVAEVVGVWRLEPVRSRTEFKVEDSPETSYIWRWILSEALMWDVIVRGPVEFATA